MSMRDRLVLCGGVFAGALGVLGGVCEAQTTGPASAPATDPASGRPSQLFRPQPQAKPVVPVLFDANKPLAPMLESAGRTAQRDGKRVLVMLGVDEAGFTGALRDLVATPDIQRLLSMEYVTVWAHSGAGEVGSGNRAWSEGASMGVPVKPDDAHATLIVLDAEGKKLGSASMSKMVDETRPRSYSTLMLQDFLLPLVAPPPNAMEMLTAARAKAKADGRGVLVSFIEYGNPWALRWRDMLRQEVAARELAQVCEVVTINLIRDKEASAALEQAGAAGAQSLPWFAMLDADGRVLESSQPVGGRNIGMPSTDAEIARMIEILSSGPKKPDSAWRERLRVLLVAERERSAR